MKTATVAFAALASFFAPALLSLPTPASAAPPSAPAAQAEAAAPAAASSTDMPLPPPPPPGPGPRGVAPPPPPPPAPRGPSIMIERGQNGLLRLDVHCQERDSIKACADVTTTLLDRLGAPHN